MKGSADSRPVPAGTLPSAGASPSSRAASRYAWLSIAAAVATMGLKTLAWVLTASVGLFGDALESLVNLAAGVVALVVLRVADRPPDEDHVYGHEKAEYFSSGAEGTLIVFAAGALAVSAVHRLLAPRAVEQLDVGLAILVVAALVNLVVALVLLSAGRRLRSITLRANAHHLLTDVWTSAGVLVGLGAVALTGWQSLDPLIAVVLAVHIGWTGFRLVSDSVHGLMDRALPAGEVAAVTGVLDGVLARQNDEVRYHALRTRRAGARSFVSFHVQVPGRWTVQQGHDLLETLEAGVRERLPAAVVFTHLEPLEDPRSYHDEGLDRPR